MILVTAKKVLQPTFKACRQCRVIESRQPANRQLKSRKNLSDKREASGQRTQPCNKLPAEPEKVSRELKHNRTVNLNS